MANLITLEEYKSYKGMGKNDNDDKINFIIQSVSSLIKAYCRHSIIDNWNDPITEDVTLAYDTPNLYLNAYPIREIVSVTENYGGYVAGLDSTVHYPRTFNSDYTFSANGGSIGRIGRNWARNITVVYKAGYENTPIELKFATIELVSYYLNEEWKPARTIQGTSIAGPAPESRGIPKHVQTILDNYRVLV